MSHVHMSLGINVMAPCEVMPQHIRQVQTAGTVCESVLCVLPRRQFETVIPTEDSVITEITMTLRDWGTMWKQLYMVNIIARLDHRLFI